MHLYHAQLLEYDSISVGSYIITIALMIGAIMGASYPDIDQKNTHQTSRYHT